MDSERRYDVPMSKRIDPIFEALKVGDTAYFGRRDNWSAAYYTAKVLRKSDSRITLDNDRVFNADGRERNARLTYWQRPYLITEEDYREWQTEVSDKREKRRFGDRFAKLVEVDDLEVMRAAWAAVPEEIRASIQLKTG